MTWVLSQEQTVNSVVEGQLQGERSGWISGARAARSAGAIGLMLASLSVLGSGCQDPQADTTRTAGQLRASVTRRVKAPAPRPLGPLTVDRAIEEALAASPQLAQMESRVAAAAEQVRVAEAGFYPWLVLSNEYTRTDNPVYAMMAIINQRRLTPGINFNDPGAQSSFSTQLQAQWSVFDGGLSYYDRQAAVQQTKGAEASLAAERNQLVSTVAQVYYQWLQARNFIAVAEQGLHSARTNEQLAEARVAAQVSLESDLLRLKAARAEAEGQLLSSQGSASRLQAAMERLLVRHIAAEEVPALDLNPGQPSISTTDPNVLVARALAQRPEIEAAAAVIAAAADRVQAARAGTLPGVVVHGNIEWDREDLSGAKDSWLAGVSVPWPLFEGGATQARLRQAKANLAEMRARGEQVALDIALDVHQAAVAAREAQQRVEIARQQLDFARQSHQEVRTQFQNQTATVEGLLQSEVAWQRAEAGYAAATYEAKVAQAMLRRALGEFAGEPPSPDL
jgi:outer membrane protein